MEGTEGTEGSCPEPAEETAAGAAEGEANRSTGVSLRGSSKDGTCLIAGRSGSSAEITVHQTHTEGQCERTYRDPMT